MHRMEAALVQPRLFRQPGAHGGQRVRAGGEDHQVVVPARAGAFRIRERRLEHALGFVEVDAVAVHLQKALLAANDRVAAVLVHLRHVAGVQHAAALVSLGKVGPALGVSERHVLAVVAKLARHVRLGDDFAVHADELKAPAGDGHAHGAHLVQTHLPGQVGHAGRGLALPIHDDEPAPRVPAPLGKSAVQVGQELSARLGERAQRGQVHAGEAHAVEHLIGVGHAAHAGGPRLLKEGPEVALRDALLGQQHGRAHPQVGIEDAQAVGIIHGQRRDGLLLRGQREVFHDAFGVGADICVALAHKLGAAGGAAGGQKQREVLVQLRLRAKGRFEQAVAEALVHAFAPFPVKALRRPQVRRVIRLVQRGKQLPVDGGGQQRGHHAALHHTRVAHGAADGVAAEAKAQAAPADGPAQRLALARKLRVGQALAVLVHKRRGIAEAVKSPHHTCAESPSPSQTSSGR